MKLREHTRRMLPTGNVFAARLTSLAHSDAAARMLTATHPERASVVWLPRFAITIHDGTPQLNVIQWSSAIVQVIPADETVTLQWTVQDSTAGDLTGQVVLGDGGIRDGDLPPSPATLVGVRFCTSRSTTTRELFRLAATGEAALVQLTHELSAFANEAVSSASWRVYREIYNIPDTVDTGVIPVVDNVECEGVADLLLYGAPEMTSSVTSRLLRRIATTDMAVRKSVMQLVASNLWSAAETAVRARIGDPHVGRNIRRLARELRTMDPEVVQHEYRCRYPHAKVGLKRVTAALSVDATVNARKTYLNELTLAAV